MEAWFVFVCAHSCFQSQQHTMKAYTYIYIYVYVFMCYMLFLGARKHFDVIVAVQLSVPLGAYGAATEYFS